MKCSQCDRPAYYQTSDGVGLCVSCNGLVVDANYKSFLMNASMINQANDDMDMAVGFSLNSGRIPVAALAMAISGNKTQNHIVVSNSNVGSVNTGDLAKINATITISQGTDMEEVGLHVKSLTEAIIHSTELAEKQKKELVDLIAELMAQMAGRRSKPVIQSLVCGVSSTIGGATKLAVLAEQLFKLLEHFWK